MKYRNIFVFSFMIAGLGVWAMAPSAQAQEKPKQDGVQKEMSALAVKHLAVGTGVENRELVGAGETFPSSTEKVYCLLEATDITKDMDVSFVWFHGQSELRKINLPVNAGSRWRTYTHKNLYGLKGDWKVEIRGADGILLKEVTFKVE